MEFFTTQMPTFPFLALPAGFEITAFSQQEGTLCVSLLSTQSSSRCPLCGSSAIRVHSRYQRTLVDLPSAGQPVRLVLFVRQFFCDVTTCAQKIFVERLAPFVEPRARVTARLFHRVQAIGFATGGMLGARLADQLGIQTSWMTILRRMMALATPPVGLVSQLGIDDFSFRRGRKFGTILVDLQSRQVIDVLSDRKAETARMWMVNHPEIELVSRDRGGDYASAAAAGAPQAVQCADRFHVLKNLGEAVEGLLAHHLAALRKRQTPEKKAEVAPVWQAKRAPLYGPKLRQLQQARREERKACYEQVVALRGQGLSHQTIADQVGVGHATVQRWLAIGTFPEKKPREQRSQLDRHLSYFFLRQPGKLEVDEQETLRQLRQLHPEIDLAYEFVQQFTQMLRTRTGEKLDDWLEKVRTSQIRQLQSFVLGIERDKAAVVAGLTLSQNNGVVEGHVNKLKLIKRMGYGRAGFPLLRQRALHAL
jgi:transposase